MAVMAVVVACPVAPANTLTPAAHAADWELSGIALAFAHLSAPHLAAHSQPVVTQDSAHFALGISAPQE